MTCSCKLCSSGIKREMGCINTADMTKKMFFFQEVIRAHNNLATVLPVPKLCIHVLEVSYSYPVQTYTSNEHCTSRTHIGHI